MKPSSISHVKCHGMPSGLPASVRLQPDRGYLFRTIILYPAFGFSSATLEKPQFSRRKLSSPTRTRTLDKRINSPLLYQLSYRGICCK